MTERDIFLAALDLHDPADRERFLVQACGGDAALRAAVDALFQSHEAAGRFLQTPLVQSPAPPDPSSSEVSGRTDQLTKEQVAENPADEETDDSQSLEFLSPSTKAGSLGRLAHYEVLEVLGRGAFGTVLKAFDEKLHRMVAIKVMSTDLASTSPARKRFLREARSSAAIRHENVVAIHSVEEQPLPYLVMECIPGQTLQQVLDGHGPLELPDILRLGQQIASGLAAAHSQGLIHRDIKPANILLEDGIQWKVKITDFGLARAADDASVTQSGMIAGTPMFMSPEQAHTNQIDQRSDLFSFGSVLYQMTSGRPPFRAPTTLAVLRRVTEETPHPIREIIPETPDWLCTIISRLHEKRPEDRYQTAQEVADLLARCQSELQLTGKVKCVPGAGGDSPRDGIGIAPSSRKASAPSSPAVRRATNDGVSRRLGRKVGIALVALASVILFSLYYPVLRLQLAGEAHFRNLTRDGKTRITFLQGEKVVAERVGFGDLELPAGEYEVRITNPDAALTVYNAVLGHRRVLGLAEYVTLSSVPEKLTFRSGDRVNLLVAFTRDHAAGGKRDRSVGAGWHSWPAGAPKPAITPFNAEQAQRHQKDWAAYLKVPVEYTNSIGMKFRLIPPGEFMMGSTEAEIEPRLKVDPGNTLNDTFIHSELPRHRVTLTQPVYFGVHEVTQETYEKLMGINPSFHSPTGEGRDRALGQTTSNFPVDSVDWNEATGFCAKLSTVEYHQPFYFHSGDGKVSLMKGTGYRLPTEAEWEFACRCGTTTRCWAGDHDLNLLAIGWFSENSAGRTHAVGELKPNPFGLYDLQGNVWEWLQDWWGPAFYAEFREKAALDPAGPSSGGMRVLRGVDANSSVAGCAASVRGGGDPSGTKNSYFGFRTALPIDAVRRALNSTGPEIPNPAR